MIKILRQDRRSIYITFDSEGNDKLISAFATILKRQIYKLNTIFDFSIINMKKTNLKDISVIFKIDNSINYSVFYKSNETIIWTMDEEDAYFGLKAFSDCKQTGCFFPAEFIIMQMPKNKNLDYIYCELVNFI